MKLNYNLVMIYVVVNDKVKRSSSSFLLEEWAAAFRIYRPNQGLGLFFESLKRSRFGGTRIRWNSCRRGTYSGERGIVVDLEDKFATNMGAYYWELATCR